MADETHTDQGTSGAVIGPGGIVAIIVAAAAVAFIFQNTETVPVEFLILDGELPLYFVIIISMLAGASLGWFGGFMRRRRRRH